NQSSPTSEFPSYGENGNDTSLLVSPLLVAGVVIGLVLFLSCVTIIVGSLRKDGRLRHPHLTRDACLTWQCKQGCGLRNKTPDDPFLLTLPAPVMLKIMYCGIFHRNLMKKSFFSFSYDECVGPGATQIYIPTDDPPPYSFTDPCQRNEISINISLEEEAAPGTTGQAANYAVRLQDLQQPISSISL
ncbi:Protein BEAN1, partial [Eudyptes chrysocome]